MAKEGKKKAVGSHPVATVLVNAIFVILCALIAFPLLAGLLASFRPGRELVQNGLAINFDFSTMTLDNYKYLFGIAGGNSGVDSAKYFMWYKNSLILTILTVVLTLLVCYFIAYGLTMYKFRLQGLLFFLVIATMCVPFEILMLPLYQEVTSLGIILAYNRSRKRVGRSELLGPVGTLPFQILVLALSLLATIGSVLKVS